MRLTIRVETSESSRADGGFELSSSAMQQHTIDVEADCRPAAHGAIVGAMTRQLMQAAEDLAETYGSAWGDAAQAEFVRAFRDAVADLVVIQRKEEAS